MKVKCIILLVLCAITIKPLFANNTLSIDKMYIHTVATSDDANTKKQPQESPKDNQENPDENILNDDLPEYDDSDGELEDIPDDFYDYQEENF